MFICHADCEVEARAVAEELKARYGVKEVYINYIGPVIGSHTEYARTPWVCSSSAACRTQSACAAALSKPLAV